MEQSLLARLTQELSNHVQNALGMKYTFFPHSLNKFQIFSHQSLTRNEITKKSLSMGRNKALVFDNQGIRTGCNSCEH